MSQHVVSKPVYYRVFATLLVLLAATVAAAQIEHGLANLITAITIAVAKAVLIVLFFMHVRYTTPLVRVFAGAGFVWLAILLSLVASDYLTRTPRPLEAATPARDELANPS